MRGRRDAREWLRASGHPEVATLIDSIERQWSADGVRTRRNWWAVIAGTRAGQPCVIAGRVFPVRAAARRRQGLDPVASAIDAPDMPPVTAVQVTGRWPRTSLDDADDGLPADKAAE